MSEYHKKRIKDYKDEVKKLLFKQNISAFDIEKYDETMRKVNFLNQKILALEFKIKNINKGIPENGYEETYLENEIVYGDNSRDEN